MRNRQVLLMGGGLGIGSIAAFVEKLISFHHEIRFVVVTGRNESLRQHLISKTSHLPNWQIIGYTDQIAELMRESSLLVTKAGAVTLAEAASSGLPTIILNPLPGHEEENTEIATMQGWALKADSIEAGQAILSQLLQNTSQLMNMRKQAFHYASPNAAFIVTNHLQDEATQERSQLTC